MWPDSASNMTCTASGVAAALWLGAGRSLSTEGGSPSWRRLATGQEGWLQLDPATAQERAATCGVTRLVLTNVSEPGLGPGGRAFSRRPGAPEVFLRPGGLNSR